MWSPAASAIRRPSSPLTEDAGPGASFPPVGLVTGPGKRRLRIGVLLENGMGHSPQPEVAAANDHAAKLVASLGHQIDYTHLPYDGGQFIQDFLLLWANGALGPGAGARPRPWAGARRERPGALQPGHGRDWLARPGPAALGPRLASA